MTTWNAVVPIIGSGQVVVLAPIGTGNVDFCVKVTDLAPSYVYDPSPLRVADPPIRSP